MNEEHVLATIEELRSHIRDMERELAETKRTANVLCKRIHREPIYKDTEPAHPLTSLRTDEFYGKPLASVVRTILERRAAADLGAASVEAIFAAMKAGGYLFDAKSDGTAKRALSISLAKNTSTFHRLPNGDFGLLEWYPNIPTKARANGRQEPAEAEEDAKAGTDLDQPYPQDFLPTDEESLDVTGEADAGISGDHAPIGEKPPQQPPKEKGMSKRLQA